MKVLYKLFSNVCRIIMAAKKLLILGAGAAGSIVANKVSRELRGEIARGGYEITVLDKEGVNKNPAGYTFIPFHLIAQEDIKRPMGKVISPRVKTSFGEGGEVTNVDLGNRVVRAKDGRTYEYDYLLIATGARLAPEVVPGLSDDYNTFYSMDGSVALRSILDKFEKGRIVVATPEMPIACPGAPSKFTVLLDDYLRHVRDIRKDVDITFLWPIDTIGPGIYDARVASGFEERGVPYRRNWVTAEVDPEGKEVISTDGERVGYDLLVTIPPHRGAKAMLDSGISDDKGWIPTDKYTLQYHKSPTESYDEVYAVGDGGPITMNKMGINAHFQALKTGQNLVNDYHGNGVKSIYKGEQGCPIVESSYTPSTDGKAYMVTWTYGNPAKPFNSTRLGWLIYRMYYYIYFDLTAKGIM
jgi:sulfide:quinone oxidoreductase